MDSGDVKTVDYAWLPEEGDRIINPLAQGSAWEKAAPLTPEAAFYLVLHGAPFTPLSGNSTVKDFIETNPYDFPCWESKVVVVVDRKWLSVLAAYCEDGEFFLIRRPGNLSATS